MFYISSEVIETVQLPDPKQGEQKPRNDPADATSSGESMLERPGSVHEGEKRDHDGRDQQRGQGVGGEGGDDITARKRENAGGHATEGARHTGQSSQRTERTDVGKNRQSSGSHRHHSSQNPQLAGPRRRARHRGRFRGGDVSDCFHRSGTIVGQSRGRPDQRSSVRVASRRPRGVCMSWAKLALTASGGRRSVSSGTRSAIRRARE